MCSLWWYILHYILMCVSIYTDMYYTYTYKHVNKRGENRSLCILYSLYREILSSEILVLWCTEMEKSIKPYLRIHFVCLRFFRTVPCQGLHHGDSISSPRHVLSLVMANNFSALNFSCLCYICLWKGICKGGLRTWSQNYHERKKVQVVGVKLICSFPYSTCPPKGNLALFKKLFQVCYAMQLNISWR